MVFLQWVDIGIVEISLNFVLIGQPFDSDSRVRSAADVEEKFSLAFHL
jgi:hypothetical protein